MTTTRTLPTPRTRRIRAGLYEVVNGSGHSNGYTVQAAEDYDGNRSGWHLIHQGEWVQTFATKASALENLAEILYADTTTTTPTEEPTVTEPTAPRVAAVYTAPNLTQVVALVHEGREYVVKTSPKMVTTISTALIGRQGNRRVTKSAEPNLFHLLVDHAFAARTSQAALQARIADKTSTPIEDLEALAAERSADIVAARDALRVEMSQADEETFPEMPSADLGDCAWFLLCYNQATGTEPHPILGDVPICDRCAEKVARLKGDIQNNRVDRVQGLRRSNAAGPHGTGRRPAIDAQDAVAEQAEPKHEAEFQPAYGTRFRCSCGETSPYLTSLRAAQAAYEAHAAGDDHYGQAAGTEPLS